MPLRNPLCDWRNDAAAGTSRLGEIISSSRVYVYVVTLYSMLLCMYRRRNLVLYIDNFFVKKCRRVTNFNTWVGRLRSKVYLYFLVEIIFLMP